MKITAFNPQIVSKDPEPVVSLFEELGFEKRHIKKNIGDIGVTDIRMKDPNGFYLDVSHVDLGQPIDAVTIRMNVDNFDEAYQFFLSHGFVNAFGDHIAETGSSRNVLMASPSGLKITLIQHIKK